MKQTHRDRPNATNTLRNRTMIFEIHSYTGVGPIAFRMTAEEVASLVNAPYREFKRTPLSQTFTGAFQTLGVFVCYDIERKCTAVEMASPAQPVFRGHELLGPFVEVRDWLCTLDSNVIIRTEGATSLALGIGLYAPGANAGVNSRVKSIIAFQRGYYDK